MQFEKLRKEDLIRIWRLVKKDEDGARALAILKKHGFDLVRIPVESDSWPGIIASIPFLPHRPARSRLLARHNSLRIAIRFLHELAQSLAGPYCSVEARDPRAKVIHMKASDEMNPARFVEATEFLEKVYRRNWVITEHNQRQNAIASLRWEIKWRTKKPHDTEVAALLDAAFRAGGFKDGLQMQLESLKKTESNERGTRKTARLKLLHVRPH